MLRGGAFLWRRQARAPRQEYRRYVEQAVCEGYVQRPWEGLVGQAVLGSRDFIEELTKRIRGIRAQASAGAVSEAFPPRPGKRSAAAGAAEEAESYLSNVQS